AGNLAQATDERGIHTGYTYDNLNRQTQVCQDTQGLYLCTDNGYDALNNQQTITDPNGIVTFQDVNFFGQPGQIIDDFGGLNAVTSYSYDGNLNLTRIIDANGNVTQYSYSPRNELTLETYADGTTVGYAYDGRGNLTVRTNQDGDTINHTYDGAGRLLGKSFSTGGSQTYTYDDASRLLTAGQTMHGHTSQLTYIYNPLNDVTATSQTLAGASWTVGYAYDYVSGVYTMTYPSGVERVQAIDPLGRLDSVNDGGGSVIVDYTYDDLNSYITVAYANGITNRTDYDALYRTTRVSSAVADYRYGYDAAGNRTYMQRAHRTGQPSDVYEYDDLYQLTQVWYGADATNPTSINNYDSLQWYDLDNLGNRLEVQNDGASVSYLPNDGSQLTNVMNRYEAVDSTAYTYDLRGNTLTDNNNTYTYDILNRQTGMSGPGGTAEYVYDAFGRRLAKIVGGVTAHFIYDLDYRVLEERDGAGSLTAQYTYGSGIDELLTMERGGSVYTYHRDALGSVTEVSNSAGSLVERYEYDVYGTPSFFDAADNPLTSSGINNPYLFTARRYDPESTNYYYRARMYHPGNGRFLQMDPLGYADSTNLYLYTDSQPVLLTDPTGLFALKIGFSGEYIIAAGPTPIPGVGWIVKVFIDTTVFECCNKNNGNREWWGTATLGISAEVMAGGSFKGKERAPNSRGSQYRDTQNKRYVKGPKSGNYKFKSSDRAITNLSTCPKRGCTGFAEGFIKGNAGFGIGGSFDITFPIYPKLQKPKFSAQVDVWSFGASISIGAKGGGKCNGPLNAVFNLF
ncbi:MAG: RHS repeat protein, partial [Chloroflexi bacterium]|nr:RHS repeat protein [Chloroflexota bacterium]